ncbi:MAG: histidinol-phosphate transaminase [Bacteroidota bacterium]
MDTDSLVRPNIRALKPYHSARQDFLSGILLDANENSFGSTLPGVTPALNRYPDPYQRALRSRLSELNGIPAENIFVGVGSDEVIDILIRIFCEPERDSVLLLEPTYGMYRVAASIQNAKIRSCLLTKDFQIDVPETKKAFDTSVKIIFCCSPNNPTANILRTEDILELCTLNSIVVVDEAYFDFAGTPSLAVHIEKIPNLIVMRTLSKAWGLAGVRLGFCFAAQNIISYMMKVKAPYNINALTGAAAFMALGNLQLMQTTLAGILKERKWLAGQIAILPRVRNVYPSDANFLLVRCTGAAEIYSALAEKNIIVRNRSTEPLLNNCLRITVGTHEENEALISTWKEIFR